MKNKEELVPAKNIHEYVTNKQNTELKEGGMQMVDWVTSVMKAVLYHVSERCHQSIRSQLGFRLDFVKGLSVIFYPVFHRADGSIKPPLVICTHLVILDNLVIITIYF